eukprot:CAMPEP_0201698366 /NCGR_PEP_ID=MMETSP0578-20130828/18727_1 /ASSEMBLY_ACC=CAM_ASM_000663 /TAXON_ID=267565 /ORGANISM="Skeletonema grethea, Strain CCMP 1804" /LENGTH=200 /DNA_ID=CAMNT_0048184879 /DNA_START=76 /DNA_END=675 /DNA_ORIENTATION=+
MVPFKKKFGSSSSNNNLRGSGSPINGNTTPTSNATTNNNNNCTTPSSSNTTTDDFSARRSARVAVGEYAADNDTWVEALAVCELPQRANSSGSSNGSGGGRRLLSKFKSSSSKDKKKQEGDDTNKGTDDEDLASASQRLTLRPYFQSTNTGQRVWDEPPSGASTILYATSEAKKMAQAQLEEMRNTYASAAVRRRLEREE